MKIRRLRRLAACAGGRGGRTLGSSPSPETAWARSANGLGGGYCAARADHEIVAMDHLGAATDAKDRHDVRRGTALDLVGIFGVVSDEATADLMRVGAAHHHGIAAG